MSKTKLNCRVFIATSLDGFIARENGDIDWLEKIESNSQEDYGYSAFVEQVDGIVMGSGSYEKVSSFDSWPYKFPTIVMSNTLSANDIPDHLKEKIEIMLGSPTDISNVLFERGWKTAYIDGGKLIQSFLAENLVSEMIITRLPILLGKGRALFGDIGGDKIFHHVSTTSYPSGLVQSHYQSLMD